jgi:hypothetical protein|tara:strand:+ start:506 stop:655 length:150 start_codon:yes stop_codon:yes gene_type:complete
MKNQGRDNPHRPMFTKWRKNKGQFKRKKYHQALSKKIAEYWGRKEVSNG